VDSRLSRRRLLQAGAAGAAGAALLPTLGCNSDDDASADDGQLNVLVLIIDSLRPDHVGAYGSPQIQTPNIDALANRGVRFNRAFPEAMVTVPARRSIFGSRRIFPFRNWKPNPVIGTSPGWLPIDDPQKTFTTVLRDNGYWTAQVSDNPFLAFMGPFEPFRNTFHRWETIVGQSGFRQDPRNVPMSEVDHWLPPFLRDERYVTGMRKYLANTGEGKDEEETCAARVFKGARELLDDARRRQPFALTIDCFDPHEPWSTPKKYLDLYGDPGYQGQEVGVTSYGFARNFTPELLRRLHAAYAGEVTLMDHWLGHFMERFRELGLHRNTMILLLADHAVHDRSSRRPRGGQGERPLRLDARRGPNRAVDGRYRPARLDGRQRPVGDTGRRRADPEARVPLRRDVQPLLHPDGRLGADRRQPRAGAHALRPARGPARVRERGQVEPEGQQGAVRHDPRRGGRPAAVLRVINH
jgi:arylsulfatase A-like enzyme